MTAASLLVVFQPGTRAHTRTSESCGRAHVESSVDFWPRVRDAHSGYNETLCTPTCWLDPRIRIIGRQDGRVAPRKVGRAQGTARAFVILFRQPTTSGSIVGSDHDEAVRKSLDCAREFRVFNAVRGVGAGFNAGFKLREKGMRGVCHAERLERLPCEEGVI